MNGIAEGVRQVRGTAVNQVDGTEHVLVTAGTMVPTSAARPRCRPVASDRPTARGRRVGLRADREGALRAAGEHGVGARLRGGRRLDRPALPAADRPGLRCVRRADRDREHRLPRVGRRSGELLPRSGVPVRAAVHRGVRAHPSADAAARRRLLGRRGRVRAGTGRPPGGWHRRALVRARAACSSGTRSGTWRRRSPSARGRGAHSEGSRRRERRSDGTARGQGRDRHRRRPGHRAGSSPEVRPRRRVGHGRRDQRGDRRDSGEGDRGGAGRHRRCSSPPTCSTRPRSGRWSTPRSTPSAGSTSSSTTPTSPARWHGSSTSPPTTCCSRTGAGRSTRCGRCRRCSRT